MAIHIDILAHLRKTQLVKEGEELKRYVDKLERDLNVRWEKGAKGRSAAIVKANDAQTQSLIRLAAEEGRLQKIIKSKESTEEQRLRAMGQLRSLVIAYQNDLKKLGDEEAAHTKRLRQIGGLTSKNNKDFYQAAVAIGKQRRELEDLHQVNVANIKDNSALAKQLGKVADAQKVTTEARKNYNQIVNEGTASYQQYKAASDRVRNAQENERRLIRDATVELQNLTRERQQANLVVDANRDSLREYATETARARSGIESLRRSHADLINENRSAARSFEVVTAASANSTREHQRYNRMIASGTASRETLIRQGERVRDSYERENRAIRDASAALRRHVDEEERRARISMGRGGGGAFVGSDIGRSAARNLGALTPLGVVTPTLVLPLGVAFIQVANAAVAAAQGIALLPAAATAAGAAIGTLSLATIGFSDTIDALMQGDLEKFAENIQKLSPSAQQAALTIQNLLPQLLKLQQSTQEAFFTGIPEMIHNLTYTFEPLIEKLTTGVAGSMNRAMRDVGGMLLSPQGMKDIGVITENITEAFRLLEPAVSAVAQAFLDITTVGSDFLPEITHDITELATSFASFIREARESGALKDFMDVGWESIKAVGEALWNLGKMIYNVFGAETLAEVETFKETMRDLTDLLQVILSAVKKFFEDASGAFRVLSNIISAFGGSLDNIGGALARLAEFWLIYHLGSPLLTGMAKLGTSLGTVNTALAATPALAAGAGAALGRAAALAQPLLAAAAIASMIEQAAPNFPIQDQPPGETRIFPGWFPILPFWEDLIRRYFGGGGAPPPGGQMPPRQGGDKKIRNKTTGQTATIPAAQEPPVGWEEVPDNWFGMNRPPGPTWGELPVPPPPPGTGTTPPWSAPPGSYELNNIPIGQFPGAQWQVPPGVLDIPGGFAGGPGGVPHGGAKPGYWEVDQRAVIEAQWNLDKQRENAEQARQKLLALQAQNNDLDQTNNATAQQIQEATRDVIESEQAVWRAQQDLVQAQQGTYKELEQSTNDLKSGLGDLGAALDADLGISKGLPGLADNLVRFLASLAAAPVLGAMRGAQAGMGFPGGEGVGSGLAGALAAGMGWYQSPYSKGQGNYYQQLGPMMPGMTTPGVYGPSPGPTGANFAAAYNPNLAAMYNLAISASGNTGYDAASDLVGGLADCSGAVSDLYEVLRYGQSTPARSFTTTNFATDEGAAALGFYPGYMPGALNVGVNPYPDQAGHMAATLPNGVNFEGGGGTGGGATYGGNAAGALSPQFEKQYFFPIPPFAPSFAAGGAVPIVAHGGEHVLTRSDVKAMGGQTGVYAFRRLLHFDQGGPVPKQPPPPPPPPSPPGLYSPENMNPALNNPPPPATPGPEIPPPPGQPLPPGTLPAPPGQGVSPVGGIAPPAGYGPGFQFGTGGLIGLLESLPNTAINMAASGAGIAAPGAGAGASAAGSIASALINMGIQEINRAISYGGQVAGIAVQGIMETFLPTGASELAQNNWFTRWLGGIVGARPAIPSLAGGQQGQQAAQYQNLTPEQRLTTMPLGPPTPEQVAAQNLAPVRTEHTGTGYAPGPTNGLYIENYYAKSTDDNSLQDASRWIVQAGAR